MPQDYLGQEAKWGWEQRLVSGFSEVGSSFKTKQTLNNVQFFRTDGCGKLLTFKNH